MGLRRFASRWFRAWRGAALRAWLVQRRRPRAEWAPPMAGTMAGTLRRRRPARKARVAPARKEKPEPKKDAGFGQMPKGPLQIVVSIGSQKVTLFSNGVRVAQGPVSTGVPGRPTPTGVFSIIEKDRYHHSNLYSNAPMPY